MNVITNFAKVSLREDRRQHRRPIAVYRERAIFLDGTIIYGGWIPECRLCTKEDLQRPGRAWRGYVSQEMAMTSAAWHIGQDHPGWGGKHGSVLPVSTKQWAQVARDFDNYRLRS